METAYQALAERSSTGGEEGSSYNVDAVVHVLGDHGYPDGSCQPRHHPSDPGWRKNEGEQYQSCGVSGEEQIPAEGSAASTDPFDERIAEQDHRWRWIQRRQPQGEGADPEQQGIGDDARQKPGWIWQEFPDGKEDPAIDRRKAQPGEIDWRKPEQWIRQNNAWSLLDPEEQPGKGDEGQNAHYECAGKGAAKNTVLPVRSPRRFHCLRPSFRHSLFWTVEQYPQTTALAGKGQRTKRTIFSRGAIVVKGARTHNLKNLSLEIPRGALTVICGVSGSGKSSLAFDTIYAEGQRRFVESLSAYARQFLDRMQKPDVDRIVGIPPAIAIEQKGVPKNPRSTVGTMTEVYDYLRLLYGRIGKTRCKECGRTVQRDTPEIALRTLQESLKEGDRLYILIPLPRVEHSDWEQQLLSLRSAGFFRFVLGEETTIFDSEIAEDRETILRTPRERVFVLIDRLVYRDEEEARSRLAEALEQAFRYGDGKCIVRNLTQERQEVFSNRYECTYCGIPYEEPRPQLFSFNNPVGACPKCQGFGRSIGIDENLVIPNKERSLLEGAIHPFQTPKGSRYQALLIRIAKRYGIPLDKPIRSLDPQALRILWDGADEYPGIRGFFQMLEQKAHKIQARVFLSRYRGYTRCPACGGSRLRTSARQVFVGGRSIVEVVRMTIAEAAAFFDTLELSPAEQQIAERVLQEIRRRLAVLLDIGLHYLTLDRLAHTLSGGEVQRINLATALSSTLTGTLYVLDEPSIGLHPRDIHRLLNVLFHLRSIGNTVIVVEHDADVIRSADHIVELGPGAGERGGTVVFQGTPAELERADTLTAAYLSGRKKIAVPKRRRTPGNQWLVVRKPRQHNLKGEDISIPLGCLVAITGVSGSGKSTVLYDVLYKGVRRLKGLPVSEVGCFDTIEGLQWIDAVELVDQSPISRSSRSTPATYTKAFDEIRRLFAAQPAAQHRGWEPKMFSFNSPSGGRCPTCQGEGWIRIEMQFLADVLIECEACHGTRYRSDVLDVRYRGKSIVDVLQMTVSEALAFFAGFPRITRPLQLLQTVGLDYLRLGQPLTTLSGGEAQRLKLVSHLAAGKNATEKILFLLDEPTTGLHFEDVARLLDAVQALVRKGHTVVVVEHNLEVVKVADWVIDLGPEGGDRGGHVVAAGPPEQIAATEASITGKFLAPLLSPHRTDSKVSTVQPVVSS